MAIVIKEIVVKATVESGRKVAEATVVPEERIEQLREEILREVVRKGRNESGKKER